MSKTNPKKNSQPLKSCRRKAGMGYERKTKAQLIAELARLRRRITEPAAERANALRESEVTFRALAENTNDGILIAVGKGVHVYANKRAGEITGYSIAELLKTSIKDLVHPDELKKITERFRKRLSGETIPPKYETIIISKDEKSVPIELTTTKTFWQRQPADLVIIRDITERKQGEQEQIRRLATVVRDSNDAITIHDFEGGIMAWNRGAELMYGYSEEEALQMNIGLLTPLDKEAEQNDFIRRLIAGESVSSFDTQRVTKDGRLLDVWLTVTKLVDDAGKSIGIASTERDITERKRAMERIAHLNAVLIAIRDVNQLIVKEKDRDILLQEICRNLIETQGYSSAWIALLDESHKLIKSAEAGIGKNYALVLELLTRGDMPECGRRALAQSEAWTADRMDVNCSLCPLAKIYPDRGKMAVRFEHGGKVYGFMTVSVPSEFVGGEEEKRLFKEVSSDIAFALHGFEVENDRIRAEEALKESEAKYRYLFEESPIINLIMDEDRRIIDTNKKSLEFFGHRKEDIIGKPIEHFIVDKYKKTTIEFIKKDFQGVSTVESEIDVFAKDGTIRTLLFSPGGIHFVNENQTRCFLCKAVDITEHKNIEEQYKTIIKTAMDGFWMVDMRGRFLDVNDAYCNLMDFSREELLTMSIPDIEAVETSDETATRIRKITKDGKDRFKTRHRCKNGKIVDVEVSVNYMKDKERMFVFLRDITERLQLETALRESENRFRMLFEHAPLGYQSLDVDGNFIDVNPAWLELFGCKQEEVIGHWFGEFIVPEEHELLRKRFEHFKAVGEVHDIEYSMVRKDGTRLIVSFDARVGYDENGNFKQTHCLLSNVTEQRRAEEALRESEERLKDAQVLGRIGSWGFDVESQKITWSDQTYKLYNRDPALGPPTIEEEATYYPPEQVQILRDYARRAIEEGKDFEYDLEAELPSGKHVFFSAKMHSVKDAHNKVVRLIGTVQDITERKEMECKIREDLREKNILLQEIHHRVKNNMQIVISLLNLQSAKIVDPQVRDKFRESQDRIYSMALVHEILYGSENLSRIDFRKYLQKLTENVWKSYQLDLPDTAFELDAESVELSIEEAVPCGLVVQELFSNALKYAFPKSWKGKPKIRICLKRLGEEIELIVSDNGVGIPKGVKIGKTKSLGLTLVRILGKDQLEGNISLERKGGTVFTIRFKAK
jgi:PAS domain S-box-containing protein